MKSIQDEADQSKSPNVDDAQETTTNEGQQDGDDAKVTTSEEQDVKEATPEGMFVSSHRTHSIRKSLYQSGIVTDFHHESYYMTSSQPFYKKNIFSFLIIYILSSVKEANEEVSLELPEENLDYEEDKIEDRPEDNEAKNEDAAEDDQKKITEDDKNTAEVKSEDSKTDKKSTDEKSRKESSDLSKSKSARVSIGKFTKGMVTSFVLILRAVHIADRN